MKREELEATLRQAMDERWAGSRFNRLVDDLMAGRVSVSDASRVEDIEAEFAELMNAELSGKKRK